MKESLYKKATTRLDKGGASRFDYKGRIFEKTMSPLLFNDSTRAGILNKFEEMIYFLVEKTKIIKTFYNYTVDKDFKNLD
jgi:hypothetical protein